MSREPVNSVSHMRPSKILNRFGKSLITTVLAAISPHQFLIKCPFVEVACRRDINFAGYHYYRRARSQGQPPESTDCRSFPVKNHRRSIRFNSHGTQKPDPSFHRLGRSFQLRTSRRVFAARVSTALQQASAVQRFSKCYTRQRWRYQFGLDLKLERAVVP